MEAVGKEEMREVCESCLLHFRAAPEKPGNHPPCRLQSPHQGLWSPRSITAQQGALPSFHGWEHMPASLRWAGVLNTQCHGTGYGEQDWRETNFLQNFWSLLLKYPCGWDSMWYKEMLWMKQLDTLPWLQLPYNLLCFKLCFQASVQPLNAWEII